MPGRNIDLQRRVVVLKTILDVMRMHCSAFFSSDHFGSCADDMVLCAAVFVGQAEGRPMNASKLAHFAGIPRATVIRKLDKLCEKGIVEPLDGSFVISEHVTNSKDVTACASRAQRLIVDSASKLSKMDNAVVASRKS